MIKHICFLMQNSFTARDHKRFGIDVIRSNGLGVIIMDLTYLLNPDYSGYKESLDQTKLEETATIKTRKDLAEFFMVHKDIFVVDCIGGSYKNIFIYSYFRKFDVPYASFCANSIPWPDTILKERGMIKKLLDMKNISRKLSHKFSALLYALPPAISGIQPPQYVLAGPERFVRKNPPPKNTTRFINAHSLDYDLYLENKNSEKPPLFKGKYAVFLDEYFPYHPDFYVLRDTIVNPYPQPEKYYNDLNIFFRRIEEKIGFPVVVAAHPRSDYDDKKELFYGRNVIKGKTIELVANSQFVLAHCSTSINFAVLYKKPIFFLTSPEMESGFYGRFISNFSKQFNKQPMDFSSDLKIDIRAQLNVDQGLYEAYKSNYIKKADSAEAPFWDIFLKNILN